MKKNYFLYISPVATITLSLLLCGCAKEVEQQQSQEELHEVVFHAGWAPETKTVLQEDGSVWWSPGDEIALCLVGHEDKYCLKSDCKEPSQETNFVGMIGENEGEDTFYAIYPYDKAKGTDLSRITIPSVQYATAGAISPGQFASFARAEGDNLTFYNVCAGLKFSVAHEGISKIVFQQRDDGVPLTGEIRIPFYPDWPNDLSVTPDYDNGSNFLTVYPAEGKYFDIGKYYYAAIAPGNTSLIMSFYTDNQVATKYFGVNSIERSKIAVLKEKDKDLVFENIDERTYAALGSNILPDGIDKNSIREVIFHTSSDVTTDVVVPSSIPTFGKDDYIPVYFEMAGTTAHYYTKAERYMMKGPSCVSFRDWKELRTIDLSMFSTSPVREFNSMFAGCINLEMVNLSSFNTSNAYYFPAMFQECRNLKELDISNFCSKNIKDDWGNPFDAMFTHCYNLTSLDLGNFEISGNADHTMFAFARNSHNCAIRCTSSTREALCNVTSKLGDNEKYITWVLPDDEMPVLEPYKFDYYSSDYSKDKTVKVLQKATVGKGINIVLLGDGYSDRLIADGSYDEDMNKAMNAIFKDEPYATFRDYFNVYQVYAVSENELTGESNTALNACIGGMDSQNGAVSYFDEYTVQKYAKIPDNNIDETCVVLILNQDAGYVKGVSHNGYIMVGDDVSDVTDYSKGGSVAMICRKLDDYSFVVAHEFGHGFAKLADEYWAYIGNMSDSEKEFYISRADNYGWWSNIDFTDNPETVKWRKILNDDRYSGTDIGIYEGATYSSGCWKPSQHSIMNNDADGIFNAPSREAIYKRIHRLAFGNDWQYDYEKFVEYDQKNIAAEKAARTTSVKNWASSVEPERKSFVKIEKSMTSDGKEKVTIIMN